MVLECVSVFFMVAVTAAIATIIVDTKKRNNSSISFKEGMELTELPVVTFYNNGKKVNFLLDTGSNNSIINEKDLKELNYEKHNYSINTFGMEGKAIESSICSMTIEYKNNEFTNEFTILDMSEAFNRIKSESGVTINGILGSKFFEKYKYVLDFAELIAYSKK